MSNYHPPTTRPSPCESAPPRRPGSRPSHYRTTSTTHHGRANAAGLAGVRSCVNPSRGSCSNWPWPTWRGDSTSTRPASSRPEQAGLASSSTATASTCPSGSGRRKRAGTANLRSLRHERFFVLIATHGTHRFFDEERIRDIREAHQIPWLQHWVRQGRRRPVARLGQNPCRRILQLKAYS